MGGGTRSSTAADLAGRTLFSNTRYSREISSRLELVSSGEPWVATLASIWFDSFYISSVGVVKARRGYMYRGVFFLSAYIWYTWYVGRTSNVGLRSTASLGLDIISCLGCIGWTNECLDPRLRLETATVV